MMTFKTIIIAASAVLLAGGSANAAVQTITRIGKVVAAVNDPTFNPSAASITGISVGSTISFSATYDDADQVAMGPTYTAFGELVSHPSLTKVGLGNGNPVNAVSLSIGTHNFSLSDQICFQNAPCVANFGLEFATGPTLLFKGSTFLGMDSCLFEGGGSNGPGPVINACQLTLDNLAGFIPSFINIPLVGYTRTDLYLIGDEFGNLNYIGQFDGPGVAGVPEPANWALLIAGFGLTGAAMRRRRIAMVAA